ncbi:amyloid fiber anchoring/assembly protein TapA [Neobacillus niacini]|uniref:amyloid fiber anchoring/assembly protein TapA n=1 Tax=Neobacillus niacini TaxID=86668 RepID=UPI00203CCCB6|nr:amyloid fiber anchoring/assembly protein TapA [Neobacillus niacini]MCM3692728.1 amyloid fiber anchoring/assembly protein TapA [Neobacillus niacini]
MRKFRTKSKKVIIAAQIVAIWYLLVISGSYLTSNTGAAFNDVEVIENSLHVNWDKYPEDDGVWGNSSLSEVSIRGTCEEGIYARFTNTGESVSHELTRYEVYWSQSDNPKNGVVVENGTFPIPDKGEYFDIYYKPLKDGRYNIKAYHETGHANGNGNGTGPWSGEITITGCNNPIEGDGNGTQTQPEPEPPVIDQPMQEIIISENLTTIQKTGGSGKVTVNLKWINPSHPSFHHVRVYIEGNDQPIMDDITIEELEMKNIQPATYRITAADESNKNESAGIKVIISEDNVVVIK